MACREPPTADVLARSAALDPLVSQWIALVRDTGRERSPGQLDGVMKGELHAASAERRKLLNHTTCYQRWHMRIICGEARQSSHHVWCCWVAFFGGSIVHWLQVPH